MGGGESGRAKSDLGQVRSKLGRDWGVFFMFYYLESGRWLGEHFCLQLGR